MLVAASTSSDKNLDTRSQARKHFDSETRGDGKGCAGHDGRRVRYLGLPRIYWKINPEIHAEVATRSISMTENAEVLQILQILSPRKRY